MQQHGQRIGFLAGGTARAPQTQLTSTGAHPFGDQAGQDGIAQQPELDDIAQEVGLADGAGPQHSLPARAVFRAGSQIVQQDGQVAVGDLMQQPVQPLLILPDEGQAGPLGDERANLRGEWAGRIRGGHVLRL